MQKWEYAWINGDLVEFSNPSMRPHKISDFKQAIHQLGLWGFELVSAYGVTNINRLGGAVTTTIGLGTGTTGRQKVEASTEHYLWFRRPLVEGHR